MGRLLVGERNVDHRSVLKELFLRLAPSMIVDFAANSEDILQCLSQHGPENDPVAIVLDAGLPSIFPGSLVSLIKTNTRYSGIPIVILAGQAGAEYYALRSTGLAALSFIKPSTPGGWELLARRIIDLTLEPKKTGHH